MSIFGLGPLEILVVCAVALIVLGPKKMVETASTLGQSFREFQRSLTEMTGRADAALREDYLREQGKEQS